MNELVASNTVLTPEQAFPFQKEIDTWNMESAVTELRPKVEQLKKASVEVCRSLFIAHEALAQRGGDRRSEDAQTFGFTDFLELVGISKKTAYVWLRLYDPATDSFITPEEIETKKLKSANPALPQTDGDFERLIAQAMATGVRGEGWTNEHERIFKMRKSAEHIAELARIWGKKKVRLNWGDDDYFSKTLLQNGRMYAKVNLESKAQYEAQLNVLGMITDFLTSIENPSVRLSAVCNIGLRVRELVNDIAEEERKLNEFSGVQD